MKNSIKKIKIFMAGAILLFAGTSAHCLETIQGTLQSVYVSAANNFGYRVFMAGKSTMCTGGPNFAYLNEADSNYKIFVANLMLALATGRPVYLVIDASGGYCHIIEAALQ